MGQRKRDSWAIRKAVKNSPMAEDDRFNRYGQPKTQSVEYSDGRNRHERRSYTARIQKALKGESRYAS